MTTIQHTTMREQMAATIKDLMIQDERVALVLAAVSADAFKDVLQRYPERAVNTGIMEQTMIGVAAGYALEGFIPFTHTIASFLIERPFEQIKDDFCYQRLGGNFVSIGASYDYGTEGMTHQSPGDVPILSQLPGMQIIVPGTARELDSLIRDTYNNGLPTYYRTSTAENDRSFPVVANKLHVLKRGKQATVIAVGPTLSNTLQAVINLDVTLLYCTTVAPFDSETLRTAASGNDIIVIEPYYEGTLVPAISAALEHLPTRIKALGVPRKILSRYGTREQHDEELGLTPHGIRQRIEQFLQAR